MNRIRDSIDGAVRYAVGYAVADAVSNVVRYATVATIWNAVGYAVYNTAGKITTKGNWNEY